MDSMSESDTTQPLSEGKVNKQNHSCANRSGLHRYYFGLGAKQNRDPDSRDPMYFQGKRKSARWDSNHAKLQKPNKIKEECTPSMVCIPFAYVILLFFTFPLTCVIIF